MSDKKICVSYFWNMPCNYMNPPPKKKRNPFKNMTNLIHIPMFIFIK